MRTSSTVTSLLFTDDSLVLMLEDGSLAEYNIEDLNVTIGVVTPHGTKRVDRRNSLGEVFAFTDKSLGGSVKLSDVAQPAKPKVRRDRRLLTMSASPNYTTMSPARFGAEAKCIAFNEDYIYIAKQGALYTCELDSLLTGEAFEVSFVSLMGCRSQWMADYQLQFLLDSGESITDSHLIMAHAWPLYVVGTSRGRVFVVPLAATHAIRCLDAGIADAVSCLLHYHNMLISCSWGGTIQVWALSMKDLRGEDAPDDDDESERDSTISARSFSSDSGQLIDPYHHLPLKTFRIPYTRLTGLKQVHYIREAVEGIPEQEWREKWAYWQRLLVGQLEDNTVLLLSMDERCVLFAFYGLRGFVKEALVHLGFDYLFLNCGDGDCYVFNMMTQQLERIIPSHAIPYRAFRRTVPIPVPSEVDETRSIPQQLLELNLDSLTTHHSNALVWVEYPTLGEAQFPVLCLNIAAIIESFAEMSECPEQVEFIISLLYSWVKTKDDSEENFQKQIQDIFKVAEPSVIANIGTFGLENSLSFRLPGECSRWEISTHLSALLSTSLLSVLSACINFRPALKPLLGRKIDGHVMRLKNRLKAFQRPSPLVLGFEALEGNQIAYELLRRTLKLCEPDEKEDMLHDWRQILTSAIADFEHAETKESTPIDQWRSLRPLKRLSISEALSTVLLCVLSLTGAETDLVRELVASLGHMLRQAKPGYVLTAALLVQDGAKHWRPLMTREMVVELSIWLLHLYHTGQVNIRNSARKALLAIGKSDVPTLCEVLRREVAKIAYDREYPDSVLTLLEAFISKHARHILISLPCVVEVILRSLDPREILLRKLCISKATDVLDVLVKKLPMVSFNPERQLLSVGTSTSSINIYDLKTATLWKELTGHRSPVNVVSFNPSGTRMVSYSITDSSLKFWKIENSFLGLGSLQVNLHLSQELPKVHSHVKFTHELLHTVNVHWDDSERLRLTREDGIEYRLEV